MGDFYFTSSSIWNFTRLVVCFATNAHTNSHKHMACTKEIIFRVCICRCVCVRVCRQMSIVTCDCSNCILHVFTSNHLIPFLFSLLIQFLFRLLLKFFVSLLSHIQRHAHSLSLSLTIARIRTKIDYSRLWLSTILFTENIH